MEKYNYSALRRVILDDPALAGRLAAIADPEIFITALRDAGLADDVALVRRAIGPDPAHISRFLPRPPDGATWPPPPWLPVHVGPAGDQLVVDWAWFGTAPLREPFFESSMGGALRRPFNRLFTYRMTMADFLADAPRQPRLPPDGLIFHMSRCGSTLVSQMLAALPDTIVISEAALIDAMVQLYGSAPEALRAIIAAYGRRRSGAERRYVLKLDCWHALALPLFRQAFPRTPWTFLYRDPVEVLVSHQRQRGGQLVPAITPPRLYGLDDDDNDGHAHENYWARALATICEKAAGELGHGGLAVNYRDLPGAVHSRILPHFGVHPSLAERAMMQSVTWQDAKAPLFAFTPDSAGKQDEARPALRAAASAHLSGVYRRLEALNHAISPAL